MHPFQLDPNLHKTQSLFTIFSSSSSCFIFYFSFFIFHFYFVFFGGEMFVGADVTLYQ
jgi:hypothetical protein